MTVGSVNHDLLQLHVVAVDVAEEVNAGRVRSSKSTTGSDETDRAKEFRTANEYLFTRLVYLPNNR